MKSKYFFLIIIILSALYGVTFENFKKYISLNEIKGDRKIYLDLSENYFDKDFDIYARDAHHRQYRLILPSLVKYTYIFVENLNLIKDENKARLLIFYFFNYLFTFITAILIYLFFEKLHFNSEYSLIAVFIFITSRVISYSIGSPLVDSIYYLSLILIFYLIFFKINIFYFALIILFSIFSKELTIPFIFLTFLNNYNLKINRILILIACLFLYILFCFYIYNLINSLPQSTNFELSKSTALGVIDTQKAYISNNFYKLFTISFYYRLFHGLALIYFISFISLIYFSSFLTKKILICYYSTFIISIIYSLLSFSEAGRMFFSTYVVVLHLTLIAMKNYKKNNK